MPQAWSRAASVTALSFRIRRQRGERLKTLYPGPADSANRRLSRSAGPRGREWLTIRVGPPNPGLASRIRNLVHSYLHGTGPSIDGLGPLGRLGAPAALWRAGAPSPPSGPSPSMLDPV